MAATNGSQDAWDEARRAVEDGAAPELEPSPDLLAALRDWLEHDGEGDYDRDRLHYGSDLAPDKCERATWYAIRGTPRDRSMLGDQLRFKGGRIFEQAIVSALKHAGHSVETQVLVKPLRPSAWAFAPGHADVLLVHRKHLLEIKAPRARSFALAKNDQRKLVRLGYRWQLSAYFHELKRRGRVETASWLFIDREGSNRPVEVPLSPELLVPLDEIIAMEARKGELVGRVDAPPRLPYDTEIRVWKGTKTTGRRIESREVRHWSCSYCAFAGTCKPGPEEQPCAAPSGAMAILEDEAKRHAEEAWASGSSTTPFVYVVAQSTAGGAAGREETRPVVAPPAEGSESDSCPCRNGKGRSKGGDMRCPDRAGSGRRDPHLWPETLTEVLAVEALNSQTGGGDYSPALSPAPPPVAPSMCAGGAERSVSQEPSPAPPAPSDETARSVPSPVLRDAGPHDGSCDEPGRDEPATGLTSLGTIGTSALGCDEHRDADETVAIETWKGGERTAVEVAPPAVTLTAEDIRLRLGRHAREGLAADLLSLTDLSLPQPTLTTEVMNQTSKIHGKDAVDALFVEVGGRYGAGKKIRRRLALSGAALRWFVSKLAPVGLGKTAPQPSATTVEDATSHLGSERPLL